MALAGDRPPRYGKKRPRYRRARACPSPCVLLPNCIPKRASSPEGLSYLAMRLAGRLHHLCRSRSPDLDLFVIRRSQTTEGTMPAGKRTPVGEPSWSRCNTVVLTINDSTKTLPNSAKPSRGLRKPNPCYDTDSVPNSVGSKSSLLSLVGARGR